MTHRQTNSTFINIDATVGHGHIANVYFICGYWVYLYFEGKWIAGYVDILVIGILLDILSTFYNYKELILFIKYMR